MILSQFIKEMNLNIRCIEIREKKTTDKLELNDVEVKFEIKYDETYLLEVGQKVYVLPTTSEQIYFICDVIEKR